MDAYRTDEEQVEVLRKWWGENGASVVFGVFLGLGAIFGWRWWTESKIQEAEIVSSLYQTMMSAAQDNDRAQVEGIADEIISDYSNTSYAVYAKLALAGEAVEANDYDSALEHLRWALDRARQEAVDKEIRLRVAKVLVAQDKYDEALAMLDAVDAGQYSGAYEELRGDIKTFQGDVPAARDAYQNAIIQKRMNQGDTTLVEMKLNDLGRQ